MKHLYRLLLEVEARNHGGGGGVVTEVEFVIGLAGDYPFESLKPQNLHPRPI
jgi:hypothetical protein